MTETKTALLFPGQGSQEKNMGRQLAEKETQAMELWQKAEKISGHPLREIFWDGEDQDMSRTEYLQPALTVVNLNVWFHFQSRLAPAFMAGHSLGEFCALCASRVLSVEKTLELVSLRGRLMAESGRQSNGGMAAVLKLDQGLVEEMVQDAAEKTGNLIIIANYNTPRQFVVSGSRQAIEFLESGVKKARGRMVLLPVSSAFHSPMMDEAAHELAKMMEKVDWKNPDCSIYFNSTAQPENDPVRIKEIMKSQMISPVYFVQLVRAMVEAGAGKFYESGPKGVLSRMIPQILDRREIEAVNLDAQDAAV
ncbi:ACP S-malonyltransferase [Desulfonatronovibrio hydrogenovorans]|uniref:ACP S-malonyltransferase n=1 Tax=Desulfonatronovibrio hydrogenovorans TaxID=53245 RepID=UPI000491DFF4|nr:ACP S-malonyltransferase [Desulfonatronovibrio hydrogenovorans]